MATECVKSVAIPAPGAATRRELPLIAGPAGFPEFSGAEPGWSEMRVVEGLQPAGAPRHVSRTKTWRKPLSGDDAIGLCADAELGLGLTERKATKRPEALTDGRTLFVPTRAPVGSVEISCVEGLQEAPAPKHVSRKKICMPCGDPDESDARFVAAELNAMKRPSELMEGEWLSSLATAPSEAAEASTVCGSQGEEAPRQVSRTKTCEWES